MAGIQMTTKEADVKSALGFTEEEWFRFQVEARYEYDTHLDIFKSDKAWNALDLAEKRESIARLRAKCTGEKGAAAEWLLHRRHLAARAGIRTSKNQEKTQPIAESSTNADKPPASTSKLKFDPVKEAAEDAK